MSKIEEYLLDTIELIHNTYDCEQVPCQVCAVIMAFDPEAIHDEDPRRGVLHDRAKKIRKILDLE